MVITAMLDRIEVTAAVVFRWLSIHRARLGLLFLGVLLPLYLFGALAEDVLERHDFGFDRAILLFLHAHASAWLDRIMVLCSFIGSARVALPLNLLVIAVFAWQKRRGDAFFWALATGGAALLNFGAKRTFARVRPDLWVSIAPETTFSFPSGHSMQSMAIATACVVLLWPTRWRWLVIFSAAIFVLLVGTSRAYLGVHYPSDILAGWTASLAWVIGVSMVLYGHVTKPSPDAEPPTVQSGPIGAMDDGSR